MTVKVRSNPPVAAVNQYSKTTKLVIGSLLGAMAAILQSAGFFTGIGYVFSMLTTMPIVMATVFSLRIGFMTYGLTIFLLTLLQPSELIVFPFTTGLLGISLGVGLRLFKRSIIISVFAGICLSAGIFIILYGFQFPVLGPSIDSEINVKVIFGIVSFSFLYSWIWMRMSLIGIKLLLKFITKSNV